MIQLLNLLTLALITVCWAALIPAASWDERDRRALISCINGNQPPLQVTSWSTVMKEQHTAVRVAEVWWSKRHRRAPLTITTGLSYDRLDQLVSMCNAWQGPISAVVHLSVVGAPPGSGSSSADSANATSASNMTHVQRAAAPAGWRALRPDLEPAVAQAVEHLGLFHRMVDEGEADAAGSFSHAGGSTEAGAGAGRTVTAAALLPCQLDLMLVYEVFDSRLSRALYPYNIIRNYARLQARTPLIAPLDVDMLPSQQLFESLANHDLVDVLLAYAQRKHVMVLPAFKTGAGLHSGTVRHLHPGQIIADAIARRASKAQLAERMAEGLVQPFAPSHAPTQYNVWFDTATQQPYAIDYPSDPRKGFEPWGIVDRRLPPFTDVRFRGYGMDKIVIMAHLWAMGFKYIVHPHAFIIHRPHLTTSAAAMYWKGNKAVVAYYEAKTKAEASNQGDVPRLADFTQDPETQVYVHAHRVGDEVLAALAAGNYTVALDSATHACRQQLPWWQGDAQQAGGDARY